MTFQRRTALSIVALVRALRPAATIVVGGYDPSLAPEVYEDPASGVDFIVRGEGDVTFRELVRALEAARLWRRWPGCHTATARTFRRNPTAPVSTLAGDDVRLPNRAARVLHGYTFVGRPIDVVETSRGCTFDCSFCSIIEMRGRNFHTWSFDRVLADIPDARGRGARAIFIVDDNITLNVARFEALCQAIIDAGLNDIDYIVQAMTSAIAKHGETLAPLMRASRIPLRVPGHREHPGRRPRVPARERQERRAGARPPRRQRHDAAIDCSTGTACSSWAA